MFTNFHEEVCFDRSVLCYVMDYASVYNLDACGAVLDIIEKYMAYSRGVSSELDCSSSISEYVIKYALFHEISISNSVNTIISRYRCASFEIDAYREYYSRGFVSDEMQMMTLNSIKFFAIDNNETSFELSDSGWM